MKKFYKFHLIALASLFIACEGKFEPNNNLDAVSLLLPENNKQCFGTKLESNQIAVDFDWDDINGITSYIINYVDGVTGQSNSLTTMDSSISIELEPGTLYTWNVTVTDDFGNSEKSEDFNFYTEGLANSNHVPFPADIDISEILNNAIDVSWEGVDLDNDIDYYQIFFSQENPPTEFINNTSEKFFNVDVETGATYYLNIVTFDANGNYSDSKLSIHF